VWVSPEASDAGLVFTDNRRATREALASGLACTPTLEEILAVCDAPQRLLLPHRATFARFILAKDRASR